MGSKNSLISLPLTHHTHRSTVVTLKISMNPPEISLMRPLVMATNRCEENRLVKI